MSDLRKTPTTNIPTLLFLLLLVVLAANAAKLAARATRSDQANLLSRARETLHRGRVSNVLVVTATVGVLDGVHRHTTHTRPAVTLDAVLVVRHARLEHGLLRASSTRHLSHHTTARR